MTANKFIILMYLRGFPAEWIVICALNGATPPIWEVDGGQIVYEASNSKTGIMCVRNWGKPEYKFEEEGEERDGYFFPRKTNIRKNVPVYLFSTRIPLRRNAVNPYE